MKEVLADTVQSFDNVDYNTDEAATKTLQMNNDLRKIVDEEKQN